MLKIFLTGDNHIGLKYASHESASEIIKSRLDAFVPMVDMANSENCNLFVIAGDLFENTYSVPKKDVKTLLDMVSKFKGLVVVLPGNHDYYDEGTKLWQYFNDVVKGYDNILILNEYKQYKVNANGEDVVIYPALCKSLHSRPNENNLGWMKSQDFPTDVYKLGIAHGAVEGETIDSEGAYFLMSRSELESIPVDAWLIGHTHVPFPKNLSDSEYKTGDKIFNAGTHVQTDVACNTDGECFIIEIDDAKNVRAKKFVSGNIRFYRKNISVATNNLKSKLDEELKDIDERSVVDIIINGAINDEDYENRFEIIENALSRFVEGTFDDHNLTRLISKELIDKEFAETSFTSKLLTSLIDEPRQAQLTYELLTSLKEGK